jgi:hypothetical protein
MASAAQVPISGMITAHITTMTTTADEELLCLGGG